MSLHALSLDPHAILGVGPGASPDEIREAYLAKSKKYHPDMGGDEWAFLMVAKAYESLKARSTARASQGWDRPGTSSSSPQRETRATWSHGGSWWGADFRTSNREPPRGDASLKRDADLKRDAASARSDSARSTAMPDEFRCVNVELVWTKYERSAGACSSSSPTKDDSTLSVWMNISWPSQTVVDCAADFPLASETLHNLIDLFERLRRGSVVATRSRIEDGRFVAWLSYANVVAAEEAFLLLRKTLQRHGLFPKLQPYDVVVPLDDQEGEPRASDSQPIR